MDKDEQTSTIVPSHYLVILCLLSQKKDCEDASSTNSSTIAKIPTYFGCPFLCRRARFKISSVFGGIFGVKSSIIKIDFFALDEFCYCLQYDVRGERENELANRSTSERKRTKEGIKRKY